MAPPVPAQTRSRPSSRRPNCVSARAIASHRQSQESPPPPRTYRQKNVSLITPIGPENTIDKHNYLPSPSAPFLLSHTLSLGNRQAALPHCANVTAFISRGRAHFSFARRRYRRSRRNCSFRERREKSGGHGCRALYVRAADWRSRVANMVLC